MKKTLLLLQFVITTFIIAQQFPNSSIMQEQSLYYRKLGVKTDEEWDVIMEKKNKTTMSNATERNVCTLTKRVFGWHPYWVGTAYQNYQWNLISDFCYFDYAADPANGQNTNTSFAWTTSTAVTTAINNGVKTHFSVTMFGGHSTFWVSSTAQQTLITNIINLLNARPGSKGVNIDFEGMSGSSKVPFTTFMQNLISQVKAANPNYEVSVCLYAVDWGAVFDMPVLNGIVDLFTIMGYDYYYSGSNTAGPVGPLYNFQTSFNYTLSKSITYYLSQGASKSKLILGLPWYGREWETTTNTIPSSTTGNFTSSRTFSYVRNNASTYSNVFKKWDSLSYTPCYVFQNASNWRQCWIDDVYSLKKRFDVVNQREIAGIGIWALGYDDGYTDYWDAIKDKFSTCSIIPCNDTIFDMGGPNRNYNDKERYQFTIDPDGTNNVSLQFTQFDLETNFDSLWIYDGNTIASPLIGVFTGSVNPGTFTSTFGALTLRFKSDNLTTRAGYKAIYNCVNDLVAPQTQVTGSSNWKTQNFNVDFVDTDNTNGSGLQKSYYQISNFNSNEWRSNTNNGFINDEFNVAIHPEWIQKTGSWSINNQQLKQSDETLSNTNIYLSLNQNLSNRTLYHFSAKIYGSGTNRRAGFHFACSRPDSLNRYDGYFVWLRVDNSTLQFYKVVNDNFGSPVASFPLQINAGQQYDYKVIYDRISGKIWMYQNDVLVGTYTDPNPYANGSYISFRTGNAAMDVDFLRAYRSRLQTVNVSVGASSLNDVRYENTSPLNPAAKVSSIIQDNAENLSAENNQLFNIDWTPPILPSYINDGVAIDQDTTFNGNVLACNYSAVQDTNSGLDHFLYAIGTSPGSTDILNWTNNMQQLSAQQNGLILVSGTRYYFSIKALNNAGLMSDSIVSDGILYLPQTIGLNNNNSNTQFLIGPNPVKDLIALTWIENSISAIDIAIIDLQGKQISKQQIIPSIGLNSLKINLNALNLSDGIYFIQIWKNNNLITKKFIFNKD